MVAVHVGYNKKFSILDLHKYLTRKFLRMYEVQITRSPTRFLILVQDLYEDSGPFLPSANLSASIDVYV